MSHKLYQYAPVSLPTFKISVAATSSSKEATNEDAICREIEEIQIPSLLSSKSTNPRFKRNSHCACVMINKMAALGSYQIGNLLGNEIACTVAGDRVYKGNVSVFDSSLKAVVIGKKKLHIK